jgi:hypothetical protein
VITLTWRQAREALCDSSHSLNEAQGILDDLAANRDRSWSYLNEDRELRWLRYRGQDSEGQPQYEVLTRRFRW